MTQRKWAWPALVCLGLAAAGCGGQAQQEAESSDIGPPPSGFYSLSVETVSDSCQPAEPQGTEEDLVFASAAGLNLALWHTGHRRQDIEWDQPFMFTSSECGASISLDVEARTSHSFVVDSEIDWVKPSACALFALEVPSASCLVHQLQTYELEQACPATRNGLSCE